MPDRALNTACLMLFTISLAGGQFLFKTVGLAMRGLPLRDGAMRVLQLPALYAALAVYGGATLLWIWILSRVPLIEAYPWVAIGMVLVPLIGWFVFNERVAPLFWLGVALILAGVLLTQLAATP